MPKHDKIESDELRGLLDEAWKSLRAKETAVAVHKIADTFLRLIEIKPEIMGKTTERRGRAMRIVFMWPALGANIKLEAMRAGRVEIEFAREKFAVSEALTYYEFTVETALAAGA